MDWSLHVIKTGAHISYSYTLNLPHLFFDVLSWMGERDELTALSQEFTYPSLIWRRRQWHPTPVLLPGKYHGWRSLVGCSPWGHWELDITERFHFHFSLSCIGEGNGNPLQCSCLENPRNGGAWWAAVDGVAQSQTRLKWLGSSSSSSSSSLIWARAHGETVVYY